MVELLTQHRVRFMSNITYVSQVDLPWYLDRETKIPSTTGLQPRILSHYLKLDTSLSPTPFIGFYT